MARIVSSSVIEVGYSASRAVMILSAHAAEAGSSLGLGGLSFLTHLAQASASARNALIVEMSSSGTASVLSNENVLCGENEGGGISGPRA